MFKFFDGAAVFFAVAVTIASAMVVYSGSGSETQVRISGAGGRWIFPRKSSTARETITVEGPLGETVVELHDGNARVLSSPCANQTCVSAGTIRRPGQWLVCLPNKVFVSISGSGIEDGVDDSTW
ncbi:hypothetical protein AGMMS49928_12450 [Spirochaetia bacterium]|nr:hypothetical protein AGMMS49928_12450 [Spirochaetia bacterium]